MGLVRRDGKAENGPDGEFSHEDPIVDEALDWFVRMQGETPDADMLNAFEAWRGSDPRHAEEFGRLDALWNSSSFEKAASAAAPAPRRTAVAQRPAARSSWRVGRIAAVAALSAATVVWAYPALKLRWEADYRTATGARETIALPDGSTMLLNTASAVALDFHDGRRDVRLLEGEAFFDVKHDPAHPFRVAGHFGETEVKGTAFAVRAGEADDSVVLERGHVEVSRLADPRDHVDLEPGEMVTASATALSAVSHVDTASALAWRGGRLAFVNQPFGRVLAELRRYYAPPVIVMAGHVNQLAVTGDYRLDDVEGAIRTLADAAGVSMRRLPGGVIILH